MERFRYILGFAIVIIVPSCFGQIEDVSGEIYKVWRYVSLEKMMNPNVNAKFLQRDDSVCDNVNSLPVLDDITFRDPDKLMGLGSLGNSVRLNDRRLERTWYRTIHEGLQYILSDKMTQALHCSTLYAMYLKEKHPEHDDISEKPQSLTVCVTSFLQECPEENTFQVHVRRCDREILYELHTDFEYSAFCFREGNMIYNVSVEAPKDVDLGRITAVPELKYLIKKNVGNNVYTPFIQFRCQFTNTSKYFYSVKWKLNNKQVKTLGPSKNSDDLCLQEEEFRKASLDFSVQCLVTVSAGDRGTGKQTNPVPSDVFLATVNVYSTELKQTGEGQISISLTLPYGCHHTDQTKHFVCKGAGNFRISQTKQSLCKDGKPLNKLTDDKKAQTGKYCTNGFDLIPYGGKWEPGKLINFTIVTSDINYEDAESFKLHLKFGKMIENKFWSDRPLSDITVRVTDTKTQKNKICSSRVDPHMTTADGYSYQQQEIGTFVLYRNKKYKIEIRQTTFKCSLWGQAACTCRIEIRAGKDVFMANICAGTTNYFGFTSCTDGGILRVERASSDQYQIYTPIGTKIELVIRRSNGFINTKIQMAPKDKNNVVGLCGYYDGTKTNDLLHSDNTTSSKIVSSYSSHNDFVTSWRVDDQSTLLSRQKLSGWVELNGYLCECNEGYKTNSPEVVCAKTQYMECKMDKEITGTKCIVTNNRKKRSAVSHAKEIDRLLSLIETAQHHNVMKREVTRESKISESEAMEVCSKMVNESVAFKSYRHLAATENPDMTMRQCMFDVRACEDKSLATVHLDVVNSVVKGVMKEVPTYVETHKDETEFFIQNTCPSNCSNRGVCSKDGECTCSKYFHGAICDIDERIPPVIEDVEGGGMCDTSDGDECKCFYFRGDNFLESMKCIIHTTQILISGEKINVTTDEVAGGFEDVFTGVCCIPEENIFAKDMFAREHDIAISSDGVHYGPNNIMYVYDSTCQKPETLPRGKMSFTLKAGYCFIEHSCFQDQYYFLADNNTCLLCNVTTDVHQWIETKLETCIPTTTQTSTTSSSKLPSKGIENASIIANHSASSTLQTFPASTTSENTQNVTLKTLSDINQSTTSLPITTSKERSTKTTATSNISSSTKTSTTNIPVTTATESSSKTITYMSSSKPTSTTSSPVTTATETLNNTSSDMSTSTKTSTTNLPVTTATESSSKTITDMSSSTPTSTTFSPVTTDTETLNNTSSDMSTSTKTSTTSLPITTDTESQTNGTSETFPDAENTFSSLAPTAKEHVAGITVASSSQTNSNPFTAITTNASKSIDDQGYGKQTVKTPSANSNAIHTSTNTPFPLNYTTSEELAISSTTKAKKRCKERIIKRLKDRLRKQQHRKQRKVDKIERISKLIVRLERLIKHHEGKSN